MASDWINFRKNLKKELGTPNNLSISELSDLHATEYVNAIQSANIVLTKSQVSVGVNKDAIKSAYELIFTKLLKETKEILPNYDNEKPTEQEKADREKLERLFLTVSLVITSEWLNERFTQITVPQGYVAPTTGYQVIVPGDPKSLSENLAKAFFVAQSEINQDIAFEKFITKLVFAYSNHLLGVSGVFNGLVPATPNPIPGPPFTWIGII